VTDIRGSNAIITGASRGIGTYIAKTLARKGVNVVLAARDAAKLEDTRRACEALGVRAVAVATDVTSRDDLRRLVETARRELGDVDIVVNNAAIEVTKSIEGLSFDEVDEIILTNLNAPIWLTKMVLPSMIERGRGAIVNVASLAGKAALPYNSIYSGTKHGLVGFTESVRIELDGTGVRIGAVCPGLVSDAGMWANTGRKAPRMARAVSPQKCADAVLKVIDGAGEVVVASSPIRPLLALGQLFPGLNKTVLKRMGITDVFHDRARELESRAARAPGAPVGGDGASDRETADVGRNDP